MLFNFVILNIKKGIHTCDTSCREWRDVAGEQREGHLFDDVSSASGGERAVGSYRDADRAHIAQSTQHVGS